MFSNQQYDSLTYLNVRSKKGELESPTKLNPSGDHTTKYQSQQTGVSGSGGRIAAIGNPRISAIAVIDGDQFNLSGLLQILVGDSDRG